MHVVVERDIKMAQKTRFMCASTLSMGFHLLRELENCKFPQSKNAPSSQWWKSAAFKFTFILC